MSFQALLLASQSPRRVELLKQVGLVFEACPAQGAEPTPNKGEDPSSYVSRTARYKGRDVQKRTEPEDTWILSADTIVVIEQSILGKPTSQAEAHSMLHQLSGREHTVMTGFSLLNQAKNVHYEETVATQVRFSSLSGTQIQSYIDSGEPMGKAGAYAIQGMAAGFIEGITGCYFNVVGLPLYRVLSALQTHGAGTFLEGKVKI